MPIRAVIFDMDGVLVDSEPYWDRSRIEFTAARNKTWNDQLHRACMGLSTVGWAQVMKERIPLPDMTLEQVIAEIGARMTAAYRARFPALPGAIESVRRVAASYKVALASGSMSILIDLVLKETGLDEIIPVVVYGDTVPNGKPAPDIYLEAARRLGLPPSECAGVEDSRNGVLSLKAAGMKVLAVPTADYPLPPEVLALADARLGTLDELTVDLLQKLG
jgi:beta-phosphoglucomutase-like phosphatase (HAD superfamily)